MLKRKINAQILAHLFLFSYLCNRKIKQITIRTPAATGNSGERKWQTLRISSVTFRE
jgi:hypothetical protein